MFGFFARVFERTLRNGSQCVRIARRPDPAVLQTPRLVVYTNHPSWWDGTVFMFVAHRLLQGRRVFTPVDAAMMERYRFFSKIGAFGVTQTRALQGARAYRACAKAVLDDPSNALIIAAQDRFADPRERPLGLAPGLSHLRDLAPGITYLPLAIEYAFRDERRPQVLLRFGDPLRDDEREPRRTFSQRLERQLTATMDGLAQDVVARNDSAFETVLSGNLGINPVYDSWRRLRAALRGERFQAGHGHRP